MKVMMNQRKERGGNENQEINTPTRRQETQETRAEREITEKINTPPAEDTQVARSAENVEELRLEPWPLDGSTATEVTRRKSSRVSIPTDRYSAEFKRPGAPRSRRGAKSSIAPSLKTLKAVLKESWAQRPEPTAPLRRRSKSRESVRSTKTRAVSLERVQTGSIKCSSSFKTSVRTRYEVAEGGRNEQEAEESS